MAYTKFREKQPRDVSNLSKVSKVSEGTGSQAATLDSLETLDTPHDENHTLRGVFRRLQGACPDRVDGAIWQQALKDGQWLLDTWGPQLERLGWTPDELFGLPDVPQNPHPSYQRLARVDLLGLVWLLHGRPVAAITADTAAIQGASGARLTFYRKAD
jgi:hypothetical protein